VGLLEMMAGATGGMNVFAAGTSAASGIASYLGNQQNAEAQRETNRETIEFNRAEAEKNRQFQESMSNSAYQRATEDMKKAGINPMLAIMKGGASSPSGSAANVSLDAPSPGDALKEGVSRGLSTAMDTLRFKNELDATHSQLALQEAATQKNRAEAAVADWSAQNLVERTKGQVIENQRAEAELPASVSESELRKRTADIDKDWVKYDRLQHRVDKGIGTFSNALQSINPMNYLRGRSGQGPSEREYRIMQKQRDAYRESLRKR